MIRVLVVDDSALMRRMIRDLIQSDPEIRVIDTASNGVEMLEKLQTLTPDVVTLDVNMKIMDGLTALKLIMEKHPLPVIMLSNATREGAEETLKALEYGAIDYVAKPSGEISLDIEKIRDELIAKVKAAAKAKIIKYEYMTSEEAPYMETDKDNVILIGASTGGPPAIEKILRSLPENVPPILVVQHMPPGFTQSFAARLNSLCSFEVKEAKEGDPIVPGQALLAPGGYHMIVGDDKKVHLLENPPIHGVRPAVDPMMITAAGVYRSKTIGVLLTGMGRDGVSGMREIKRFGGRTIAQDETSCTVFGMPKAAIEAGCVDKVLPLFKIPGEIMRMCKS
ncbi:MAG: chemotaxis response regulator protein-glutamate methylesterase [Candidatus Bathyarchaeia archaeon]